MRLRYRPVDQSQTYAEHEMDRAGDRFVASIPGADSDTPFAMQYLFAIHDANGDAWLHPGLGADLSDQPYYVVRPLDG